MEQILWRQRDCFYEYNVLYELKQSLLRKSTQRYYEYLISILRNDVFKNVTDLRSAYKEKSVHYCPFEPSRKVVIEHCVEEKMGFSFLWFSAYVTALVMCNKLMSSKNLIYVTNILFSIKQLLILTIFQYSREIKVINLPILNVYIL